MSDFNRGFARSGESISGDQSIVPPPRVVVTGVGLVTSLGKDRESTWTALKASLSGARRLDWPRASGERPYLGCPVLSPDDPDCDPIFTHLGRAVDEAAQDAKLYNNPPPDLQRAATLIGLSKGGFRSLTRAHRAAFDRDDDRINHRGLPTWPGPNLWEWSWPSAGAAWTARRLDFQGPCLAPVAACATGLVAVLQGAALIRRGVCDVAIAGSADASLEPMLLASFRKMRVLARDVDGDPAEALRPWDRARSGFIVGEGAAVLVLERDDHARARGALPYAEVLGGALGSDAFHMTDLNPDPSDLAALIRRAFDNAEVAPDEIDHVNVHGTATRVNDPLECRALRLALGRRADRAACSANKSQIGHLLGAAGAAELAITCLAIRDQFAPPTLNLTDPDPSCDLDGTPLVGRPLLIRNALKLSVGFGGHLAAAVLRRPDQAG